MSFHPAVLACFPLNRNRVVPGRLTEGSFLLSFITVAGLNVADVLNFCLVDKNNFTIDSLLSNEMKNGCCNPDLPPVNHTLKSFSGQ